MEKDALDVETSEAGETLAHLKNWVALLAPLRESMSALG